MKYTVLGAKGFIGSHLAQALRMDGHEVFAPLRDDKAVFSTHLGRVFYCIGMTADFAKNAAATVEAHAGVISRLVEGASFDHIVYLSSTRLYDGLKTPAASTHVALPMNPQNPRHLYDLSKALGENLCLTIAPGKSSVARLSGVFDWTPGSPGFLSEWLQRAARERVFTLDSASGIVRDYIHLHDTIRILRALADRSVTGITNTASGENVSNSDIAALFNAEGWEVSFARHSERQVMPVCEIARLDELGVKPQSIAGIITHRIRELKRRETD